MSTNADRIAEAIVGIRKHLASIEALMDSTTEAPPKHSMHKKGEWFYACEACSGLPDGDRQ